MYEMGCYIITAEADDGIRHRTQEYNRQLLAPRSSPIYSSTVILKRSRFGFKIRRPPHVDLIFKDPDPNPRSRLDL